MKKIAFFILVLTLFASSAYAVVQAPSNVKIYYGSSTDTTKVYDITFSYGPNATYFYLKTNESHYSYGGQTYVDFTTGPLSGGGSYTISVSLSYQDKYYFSLQLSDGKGNYSVPVFFWIDPVSNTSSVGVAEPSISNFEVEPSTYNGHLATHIIVDWDSTPPQGVVAQLYRSTDGKNYTEITPTATNVTATHYEYYDTDVESGETYYYYEKVTYANGTDPIMSDIKYVNFATNTSGTIKLTTPKLFEIKQVTLNGKPAVLLEWTAVEYATGYEIYRSTSLNGNYGKLNITYEKQYEPNGSYYYKAYDESVRGGVYYYYVVAIGANGDRSMQSNILWVNVDTGETGVIPVSAVGWVPLAPSTMPYWLIAGIALGAVVPLIWIYRRKRVEKFFRRWLR